MDTEETRKLLQDVADGRESVGDALLKLQAAPFEDLGFAKVDLHRGLRQGFPEVIYGAGKTAEEIAGILAAQKNAGEKRVIVTRLECEKADRLREMADIEYFPEARFALMGAMPEERVGKVVVASGGTSDFSVAEEAALTAEAMGANVVRLYDVGVAGLHRLLSNRETLMTANSIVAVAGMEGALASVIAGLTACPVIGVPTSVGYGASLGGISALLSMINSCASGVSVVNIDNGFGGGYTAAMINRLCQRKK